MASPTWWTWVWANFGSWWCTGKPGVLQSLGSQRVRHDWATEWLNWSSWCCFPWSMNVNLDDINICVFSEVSMLGECYPFSNDDQTDLIPCKRTEVNDHVMKQYEMVWLFYKLLLILCTCARVIFKNLVWSESYQASCLTRAKYREVLKCIMRLKWVKFR